MINSDHPAIAIAESHFADFDERFGGDFSAAALCVADDAVGVLMYSSIARFIAIVENVDGQWCLLPTPYGGQRPTGPQRVRTVDYEPLRQMGSLRIPTSRTPGQWWFGVAGLAARDATEIALDIGGHEHREPIGDDGIAFMITRIQENDEPTVTVHTRDGRPVRAA